MAQPSLDPTKNPYATMITKLSGLKPPPLKARQGALQLMHEQYDDLVRPEVERQWDMKKQNGLCAKDRNDANFRAEIARTIFKALPKAEREGYERRAKEDKEKAVEEYEAALRASKEDTPANRKRYVYLISFQLFGLIIFAT